MKSNITHTLLTAIFLMVLSVSAWAMDLSSAKQSGLLGELPTGLVSATLPNPSPELLELVNKTNSGRLDVYKDTASRESIPLKEVQSIAAEKIYNMAAPGDFLMINGKWTQK